MFWSKKKPTAPVTAATTAPEARPETSGAPGSSTESDGDEAIGKLQRDAAAGQAGAIDAFWKAVFQLETWHFLPGLPPGEIMPAMAAGKPVPPMVARVDGRRFLIAFTSERGALDSAKLNGMQTPDGVFPLLSTPRDAAVAMVGGMSAETAEGVLFNQLPGVQGAFMLLDNVGPMYEWHLNRMPPGEFGRWVLPFARGGQVGWGRFVRQLVRLPQWLILSDPDHPNRPVMVSQQDNLTGESVSMVAVFTDAGEAEKARAAMSLGDGSEAIPGTPFKVLEALVQVFQNSNGRIGNAAFNAGGKPFVVKLADLAAGFKA